MLNLLLADGVVFQLTALPRLYVAPFFLIITIQLVSIVLMNGFVFARFFNEHNFF